MSFDLDPLVLADGRVRLVPALLEADSVVDELVEACTPGMLALFSTNSSEPSTTRAARRWLDDARKRHRRGDRITYLVRDASTSRLLGSTCFLHLREDIPGVEVGGTWYRADAQGTLVNPSCKRLLLGHAFDELGCHIVWFRTSHRNLRSQRAITGLGARFDGVHRSDQRQLDGERRDSHLFSIDADTWPSVRDRLDRRLAATPRPTAAVELCVAAPADAERLTAFLCSNRAFHAPFDPPMPERTYTVDEQRRRIEQVGRVSFLALDAGAVVGTASLSNIVGRAFLSANLGYKVAEHAQGRGIATALVEFAVEHARSTIGLHRIEAGTLLDNVASQRVLLRCGFERIGTAHAYLNIAGAWRDHLLHQRTFDEVPPKMA